MMWTLLLLASVPLAATDCSVMSPCGECGDDHCTIAGCPFRGFECNALNDNQPNEVAGTCRYNVLDADMANYNGGSCQDMCETFGLDCLRMEEYSDNLCEADFVATHDCADTMDDASLWTIGHVGHAFCTCTPAGCVDCSRRQRQRHLLFGHLPCC